jgi:hypothetical protein
MKSETATRKKIKSLREKGKEHDLYHAGEIDALEWVLEDE